MASPSSSSRIYEYKFIAELDDDLKCLICLGVAIDPFQHQGCGKLFCKACLEEHGRDKPCPNCRKVNFQYFEDIRGRRVIQALRVKCDNIEKCEWEGTVATLEQHVATCQFTPLPCPKQCKDSNGETTHFMRKDLDDHLEKDCPNRDYKCQYCGEEGTYAKITDQVHDKMCDRKIIPCCNAGCTKTMQRREVEEHKFKCGYTVIPCKYESIGCGVKMKRRDMAAHEQDDKQSHLDMAMDTTLQLKSDNDKLKSDVEELRELKNGNAKLKSDVAELRRDLQSTINILQFPLKGEPTYKLTDYQKKKEDGGFFTFPSFYSHPRGYHMALRVDTNGYGPGKGTHVSVTARIVKGDYDAELKWPFLGKVTFTLLNQLEDENHHTLTLLLTNEHNARVGDTKGKHKFIPHSKLAYDTVRNTQYLKDDTLYFRMSVAVAK